LIEAPHLEINKIHFAALIDLDGWQNKTDNYLSFVRGATRSGEISEYFTDFIGCQVTSSSAVTSSNFTNGLMEFARTTYPHPNLKERLQFIDKIVNLIQVYKQQKKDIELEEFCNTLDSNQSHDIKNFLQNNYKVDSLFTFDSSAMKQLKYHTYKVRNVSISFPIGFDKYEVDINNKKLIIELEDLEFLKNLKR
jgi:nucleoid-associated protein